MASRTVLTLGGTGAIGRAAVARLRADGLDVVVARRGPATGDDEIGGVDLSDRAGVERCLAGLAARGVSPDVVVALAAAPTRGALGELTDAELAAGAFVKVWAPGLLAEALCPAMADRGFGRVVVATGITGREPVDGYLAGAAVNAAARALVKGLAPRWADRGVTVNAVSPGPVAGDRFAAVQQRTAATARNPFMRGPAGMPAGRYLDADELAAAIAFLCGDGAGGVNGTELLVDGAASLGL